MERGLASLALGLVAVLLTGCGASGRTAAAPPFGAWSLVALAADGNHPNAAATSRSPPRSSTWCAGGWREYGR